MSSKFFTISLYRSKIGDIPIIDTIIPFMDVEIAKKITQETLIKSRKNKKIKNNLKPYTAELRDPNNILIAKYRINFSFASKILDVTHIYR